METGDILECAQVVLGSDLTPAQSLTLERCCEAAKAQCLSRLREKVTEEIYPVVLQACGTFAAGLFLESQDTAEVASFTAGKLSVTTKSGTGTRAQALKTLALEMLAPFVADAFAFLGVRG